MLYLFKKILILKIPEYQAQEASAQSHASFLRQFRENELRVVTIRIENLTTI